MFEKISKQAACRVTKQRGKDMGERGGQLDLGNSTKTKK